MTWVVEIIVPENSTFSTTLDILANFIKYKSLPRYYVAPNLEVPNSALKHRLQA